MDNHIHAVIHGVRLIQPFCVIPIEEASYLLGSFDAGTWVLNIDYRYVYDGTDASFIEPVDTVTFDVLPTAIGSATPVPTLDRWGKGALALLAIAMAGCGFRRRMFAARA